MPEVLVLYHIHYHTAYGDLAFNTEGDPVGVIAYPYIHFLTAFEHGAFNEQGLKMDSPELTKLGAHLFLADIADIDAVHLIVYEHAEGNLIIGLILVKVDVTGIINGADHVLYAIRHFKGAVGAGSGIMRMVEGNVVVYSMPALTYVAHEFKGFEGGSVYIAFVFIPHFKEPVVCAIGFAFAYQMVYIVAVQLFSDAVKGGVSCADVYTGKAVIYFQGHVLNGLETSIGNTTKLVLGFYGITAE